MKKTLALIISVALALGLAACVGDSSTESSAPEFSKASDAAEAEPSANEQTPPETVQDPEQPEQPEPSADAASPLALLSDVWGSYGEDEKFPVAGGDMSEENMTMDGAGKYALTDAAALDSALGFPAASVDMIDDAASIVHMMNANTFTCGAYHLKNADDLSAAAAAVKDNIMTRQWICGFPDKLVVAAEGDCLIAFFGENELVDTFKTKLAAACPDLQILSEDPIQ